MTIHGTDCAVRGPTYKCDCGIDDEMAEEIARLRAALQDALDGLHNDFEPDNQSARYRRIKAVLAVKP